MMTKLALIQQHASWDIDENTDKKAGVVIDLNFPNRTFRAIIAKLLRLDISCEEGAWRVITKDNRPRALIHGYI